MRALKVTRRKGDAKPQFDAPATVPAPPPSSSSSSDVVPVSADETFTFPRKTLADLTATRKDPVDPKVFMLLLDLFSPFYSFFRCVGIGGRQVHFG
jgi:hypothetical protein